MSKSVLAAIGLASALVLTGCGEASPAEKSKGEKTISELKDKFTTVAGQFRKASKRLEKIQYDFEVFQEVDPTSPDDKSYIFNADKLQGWENYMADLDSTLTQYAARKSPPIKACEVLQTLKKNPPERIETAAVADFLNPPLLQEKKDANATLLKMREGVINILYHPRTGDLADAKFLGEAKSQLKAFEDLAKSFNADLTPSGEDAVGVTHIKPGEKRGSPLSPFEVRIAPEREKVQKTTAFMAQWYDQLSGNRGLCLEGINERVKKLHRPLAPS